MSGGWVRATVRAQALSTRRLGRDGARDLARTGSLGEATATLAAGPYGHDVRPADALVTAQRGVTACLLWNLRVLAGWLPRDGVAALRALAAWFELARLDEHVLLLSGVAMPEPAGPPPAYRLGALATAWSRLESTGTLPELRARLAATPWSDPGGDTGAQIQLGLRLAWAERVARDVPPAAPWAAAATALLLAREAVLQGRRLPPRQLRTAGRLLGPVAASARDLAGLASALPRSLSWVMDGVGGPEDLWRAEPRFWRRVDDEAFTLSRSSGFGLARIVGVVGMLAVDAWRVRVALALADHGPAPGEVLDALV